MSKTLNASLSTEGINYLISQLASYEVDMTNKFVQFRQLLALKLSSEVASNFVNAVASTSLKGTDKTADVSVRVETGLTTSVIFAEGEDVAFVEFGAGISYNSAAGTSPHPNGENLGMTIGSYGQGKGKRKVWGYYEDGELVLTKGTPASMPMYNACKTIASEIRAIATEVFG